MHRRDSTVWVRATQIIDGRGGPPMKDAAILIHGSRIAAIGPAASIPPPAGGERMTLEGHTLLPGFVDAHSHLYWFSRFARPPLGRQLEDPAEILGGRAVQNLMLDLKSGAFTLRIVSERNLSAMDWRESIRAGSLPGPRVLAGGVGIRAGHGHGKMAAGYDGVEAIRGAVRRNLAAGADVVKIYVSGEITDDTAPTMAYLTPEEIVVAVEEAHAGGKPVAAHCHGGKGLTACLAAGVDTIEHGAFLSESDIDLMIKHRTWLVATLSVIFHEDGIAPELLARPAVGEKRGIARENLKKYLATFVRSGGRLALGTDARHGMMAHEIQFLAQLGVSPMQAIQAGTIWSAEACNLSDEVGTLETGKLASIVGVPADPLEDLNVLKSPSLLVNEGMVLGVPGSVQYLGEGLYPRMGLPPSAL